MHIGDGGVLGLVLAQRADGHAVGLIADDIVVEANPTAARADGAGVVAVVDDRLGDLHIGGGDVEAVGIEGEAARHAVGVDDGVGDVDVGTLELHSPGDGLAGFEMLHRAARDVEEQQVRPAVLARGRVDVGVPPELTVAIDPASRHVWSAFVQQIGATEGKPVQVVGAGGIGGVIVQCLDVGDVLRQIEVAVHLNGDVAEVQRGDRLEDIVFCPHFEADRAAFGAFDKRIGDGVRIIRRIRRFDHALGPVAVRRCWRPLVGRRRTMAVSPLRRGCRRRRQRCEREERSELDHAEGASRCLMGWTGMRRRDGRSGNRAYLTVPNFSAAPPPMAINRHNFSVRTSVWSDITVLPVDERHPIAAFTPTITHWQLDPRSLAIQRQQHQPYRSQLRCVAAVDLET